ncbi:glycosyltransferase [Rhizobium sp. F40D2]|uniref:glycosyltransferase family 2 protein n=1 Tax=Rhizobium sp. F40D2 TaxID=3453141 RepID=UPI003F236ABC
MTSNIPLTFIIPTYGRQDKLVRAITSILSQDWQPEEIIVVDDASPQPLTLPAAFAETGRVRIIRQSENRGPAACRNVGMLAARTDWVSFLDSDDWLLPGTLQLRWFFWKMQRERARQKAAPCTAADGAISNLMGRFYENEFPSLRSRPQTSSEAAGFLLVPV